MYSSSKSGCEDPAGMHLNEPGYAEAETKALGVECEVSKPVENDLTFSFGEIFFIHSQKLSLDAAL